MIDVGSTDPDLFDDVLLAFRTVLHNRAQLLRLAIAGVGSSHWRHAVHTSEIRIALERLGRLGVLFEV